jgi:hypothetical protein
MGLGLMAGVWITDIVVPSGYFRGYRIAHIGAKRQARAEHGQGSRMHDRHSKRQA